MVFIAGTAVAAFEALAASQGMLIALGALLLFTGAYRAVLWVIGGIIAFIALKVTLASNPLLAGIIILGIMVAALVALRRK